MKKFLLVLMSLLSSAVAFGQNRSKMDLSTLEFLEEQQSEVKREAWSVKREAWRVKKMSQEESECQYVDCFICYSKPCEDALEALGVQVMVDVDGIMTARVPVTAMVDVADLEEVTSLNVGGDEELDSDIARADSHVFDVQRGKENGLPMNYDGTGVVLGVIDGGIDFTHPAFRTADGHSICTAVYFPNRMRAEGTPPVVVDGKELPGVLYVNRSDIDTLTTDTENSTHGTHVLGIAAGRNIGPYGGVAPGVDLVACPLGGDYKNVAIMNSMAFLLDYAKKVGKPLVISKSLGSLLGSHDGTSDYVKMQDKLLGKNAILCNSNGNAGARNCYLCLDGSNARRYKDLYYHAFMARPWINSAKRNNVVTFSAQVWCEDDKPFDLAFVQWDGINGFFVHKVVKYEDFYENGSASVTITNMEAGYVMEVSGKVNATNKKFYANLSWLYVTNYQVPSSSVGVMLLPRDKSQVMHMWLDTESAYLVTNNNLNQWDVLLHEGSSSISTNDQCSSTKMISVGNFVTRVDYPVWLGTQTTTEKNENPVGSISIGSSYGTTLNGVKSPTVCAPGAMIVSSVCHFDKNYGDKQSAQKQTVNGTDYYWATQSGTSMSTPHAAGIMALWLQANPRMTRKDIFDVLAKSSIPCDKPQEKERWGQYGRIDALAGLKYVLQSSDVRSVEAEEALLWTDVYNLNGQLIRKRVATESALEGLPAGIYVTGGRKVVVR
ncbi:MAG: S8 family serine peptidase [Bacteroidaceae bacterium]|nr:S8 family serine peptidase [Bacteroidaceae bacterium]